MPTLSTNNFEEPQSLSTAPPGQPTLSSSSSTSTDGSGSPNVSSNPSLILAFLALSFFTMAMVFIFGFRRYQFLQDRLHEVFGRPGGGNPESWQSLGQQRAAAAAAGSEEMMRLRGLPGTKPRLWDVCTDTGVRWEVKTRGGKSGGDPDGLWSWDDVTPLSASKVVDSDELGRRSANPAPSLLRRFWRFRATAPVRSSDKQQQQQGPSLPTSRLRLAFLVAMPSERYPIYYREDRSRHERGTVGCELGLYELPWNDDDDVTPLTFTLQCRNE